MLVRSLESPTVGIFSSLSYFGQSSCSSDLGKCLERPVCNLYSVEGLDKRKNFSYSLLGDVYFIYLMSFHCMLKIVVMTPLSAVVAFFFISQASTRSLLRNRNLLTLSSMVRRGMPVQLMTFYSRKNLPVRGLAQ